MTTTIKSEDKFKHKSKEDQAIEIISIALKKNNGKIYASTLGNAMQRIGIKKKLKQIVLMRPDLFLWDETNVAGMIVDVVSQPVGYPNKEQIVVSSSPSSSIPNTPNKYNPTNNGFNHFSNPQGYKSSHVPVSQSGYLREKSGFNDKSSYIQVASGQNHPKIIYVANVAVARLSVADLLKYNQIAVDCEFSQPSGNLSIVQIGRPFCTYIFDILSRDNLCDELRPLFNAQHVMKIFHDCSLDIKKLRESGIVNMENIQDTQVFHAYLIKMRNLVEKKNIKIPRLGLNALMEIYGLPGNHLKGEVNHRLWGYRPLNEMMLQYAAKDVENLILLHQVMNQELNNLSLMQLGHLSYSHGHFSTNKILKDNDEPIISMPLAIDHYFNVIEKLPKYTPIEIYNLQEIPLVMIKVSLCDSFDKDLKILLDMLPQPLQKEIENYLAKAKVDPSDVVLDESKYPRLRFTDSTEVEFKVNVKIPDALQKLQIVHGVEPGENAFEVGGKIFNQHNFTGVPGTLHKIACIRNRKEITGLTYVIGRHIKGSSNLLEDLIFSSRCVLLVGPSSATKATVLRDITNKLSQNYQSRVVVIDTQNEIGGHGRIPHSSLASARRMTVTNNEQHKAINEAIYNHNAQAIIVEQLKGSNDDLNAAMNAKGKKITFISSVGFHTIESMLFSSEMSSYLGGVVTITKQTFDGTEDRIQQRTTLPVFTSAIEVLSTTHFRIYKKLITTIDCILNKEPTIVEERWVDDEGRYRAKFMQVGRKTGSHFTNIINNETFIH